MAVAFVKALQAAGGTSTTSSATVAVTTNGAVAAGNHIIGLATSRLSAIVTLSSVTATGATFQVDATIGAPTGGTGGMGIFSAYCPSGLASGVSVTATFSAASTRKTIALFEFSGIATASWAYGALTNNATAATNPTTVANLTGLTVGDLAVGGMQLNNATGTAQLTAGTGFAIPASGGDTIAGTSSWDEGAFEYLLSVPGTTQSVQYVTTATANWSGGGVAYHAAAAAAAGNTRSGVHTRLPVLTAGAW